MIPQVTWSDPDLVTGGCREYEFAKVAFSCNCRKNYHLDSTLTLAVECKKLKKNPREDPRYSPLDVGSEIAGRIT